MDTKSAQSSASNFNLYLATCAANLVATSAGCAMTWTSPTLPKLQQPNDRLFVTKEQGAWIGSFLPLGACFGPLVATLIVDKIGKKFSLILCAMIILIHWIVIAMINTLEGIYFARFLTGMAVGSVFNLLPIYVAEISSVETRSTTGAFFLFFLGTGYCITYIIGPYTSVLNLIMVCAALPLLTMFLFMWMPESPYHLLDKGRKQQAFAALQWLRTYPDKGVVQQELADLQEMLDKSHREKFQSGSPFMQLSQSRNFKCLYYACALILFQQMAGYNAVVFYSEAIFQKSSSALSSSVSTIICGLIMWIAGALVPVMGKLFRVMNLLYFSATGCCFCLGILGFYFFAQERGQVAESFNWVPIACITGYIICHSFGLGSYSWVIIAEIFHPNVKTLASALTTSFCWFLCFLITRFFSFFIDNLGSANTFWLFAAFCFIAVIFLAFQLPDTQGKSFQEIQDLIGGKKYAIGDEEAK